MWPAGQRLGLTRRRPGLRLPQAWAWHTSPPLTTRVSGGQAPPRDPPAQGNRVPRLPGGREEPPAAWPQLRVEGLRAGAGAGTAQGDPVGLASGLCVSRESSHTRSGRSGWVQSAALLGAAAWALGERPRGRLAGGSGSAPRPCRAARARLLQTRGPQEVQGRPGSPPLAPGGWPSRWQRALAARSPQRSKGHGVKAQHSPCRPHAPSPGTQGRRRASVWAPGRL